MKKTVLGFLLAVGVVLGTVSIVAERANEASAIAVTCADQAEIYIGNMNPPKTIDGCQIALSHCLEFCTLSNCNNNPNLVTACRLTCINHYGAGHCP